MMRGLPHIFGRVFNTPLAIPPFRLEPLLKGLAAASLARGQLLVREDDDDDDEDNENRRLIDDLNREWTYGPGYAVSREGVGVLPVRGILVKRAGQIDANSTEFQSYARIGRMLRLCVSDPRVRALLLDVDSPGGEVGGLFELVDDIRAAGTVKPIWAIANDDAMSAGYAIASAASQLWLTGVGGVGSIGVVAMHCDQSAFDAAEGLAYTYIHAGERKVDANPHEPLSDRARASVQAEVDRLHEEFVAQVGLHRGLSAATVRDTEAAVIYGPAAIDAGLADAVGTFSDAVTALGDFAADRREMVFMDETNPGLAAESNQPTIGAQAETVAEALEAAGGNGPVVRLDLVRQATATVRRENAEIVALCNLAGLPGTAADFITRGTPIQAVRIDLQRRQAEATEARPVENVNVAAAGPDSTMATLNKVLTDRWSRQMGRP